MKFLFLITSVLFLISFSSFGATDIDLQIQLAKALGSENLFLSLGVVFIAGILTSFTPCVYPLIPITLGVMGARSYRNRLHNFLTALMYVLGMVFLYGLLGVIFARLGILFGSLFQSSSVMLLMATLCFVMGSSMFGIFEIAIPQSIHTKLSHIGGKGYKGAFLMGLVAGIIAAPCTGPVLSVILAFIATSQNIILGYSLIVTYALGIGILFLFLGMSAGMIRKMPKSGKWMDLVKLLLGIGLCVVGWYYLQFIFSKSIHVFFSQVILSSKMQMFMLFILSSIISIVGIMRSRSRKKMIMIIGGGLVAFSVFFSFVYRPRGTIDSLHWIKSEGEGLSLAMKKKKPAIIDFYADWCGACTELDEKTFIDDDIQAMAEHFVMIKIDATESSSVTDNLFEKYEISGLPVVVFLRPDGSEMKELRVIGFTDANDFMHRMEKAREQYPTMK